MTSRIRLWAVVVVAYVSTRLLVRLVTAGALTFDRPFVSQLLIVPACQIAALEVVKAWLWRAALTDEDSCES